MTIMLLFGMVILVLVLGFVCLKQVNDLADLQQEFNNSEKRLEESLEHYRDKVKRMTSALDEAQFLNSTTKQELIESLAILENSDKTIQRYIEDSRRHLQLINELKEKINDQVYALTQEKQLSVSLANRNKEITSMAEAQIERLQKKVKKLKKKLK